MRPPLEAQNSSAPLAHSPWRARLQRALRMKWLGQTAASLFWLGSMLAYGVSTAGDWLQVFAASAWLVANIAALAAPEERR